jgi:hypothetical protein
MELAQWNLITLLIYANKNHSKKETNSDKEYNKICIEKEKKNKKTKPAPVYTSSLQRRRWWISSRLTSGFSFAIFVSKVQTN